MTKATKLDSVYSSLASECVCVSAEPKTAHLVPNGEAVLQEMSLSFDAQRHPLATARPFGNCEEGTGGYEGRRGPEHKCCGEERSTPTSPLQLSRHTQPPSARVVCFALYIELERCQKADYCLA